jgi:hypothetical protein
LSIEKYKSAGRDQIPAELIQAGWKPLLFDIHHHINFFWNKVNCLTTGWSSLIYQFTQKVAKLEIIFIVVYHCYQLHTKLYMQM